VAASVSPASGSGATQLFTFNFTDADGAIDISMTEMLVNGSLTGIGGCYVRYNRPLNQFWLYTDDAGALLGPVTPGEGTILQNNQCSLNAAASAVASNANTLSISVSLTFSAPFGGSKTTYAFAWDSAPSGSNWQALGSWVVPAPPIAVSVLPAWGNGAVQTFTFTFTDYSGGTDISWTQMIFNSSLSGIGACYIHYSRVANQFWLYNDGATVLIGPVSPGQGAVIQNSQCSLNGVGSSTSVSGPTLTLSVSLTFKTAFGGGKNVYLYAQDTTNATSNWQVLGSWSAPGATNQPPSSVSVSPAWGIGVSQSFTFTFSDPNAAPDIYWTQMLFNASLAGAGACFIHYSRPLNQVWLFDDAATSLIGLLSPGKAGVIQNSQCSIDGAASSTWASGNTLTLTLSITFRAAFGGGKNIYLFAQDTANANSNWQSLGSWSVPSVSNQPPAAVSVSPLQEAVTPNYSPSPLPIPTPRPTSVGRRSSSTPLLRVLVAALCITAGR
jgi:hypothetical protein